MMYLYFCFYSGVLVFVSASLIHPYVTTLMKIFIFPNLSMHLLSFDE